MDVAGTGADGVTRRRAQRRRDGGRWPPSRSSSPWLAAAPTPARLLGQPPRTACRIEHQHPARGCGPSRPWTCSTPIGRSAPSASRRWPRPTGRRASSPRMENLWWDRPFTVTGIDVRRGAGHAAPADSYGAAQDIDMRTDDERHGRPVRGRRCSRPRSSRGPTSTPSWPSPARATRIRSSKVDRRPAARRWRAATPTSRCRWRRSSNCMCCSPSPTRSRRGRSAGTTQLTITERGQGRRIGRASTNCHPGAKVSVRTAAQKMIVGERQHGDRSADRAGRHPAPSSGRW